MVMRAADGNMALCPHVLPGHTVRKLATSSCSLLQKSICMAGGRSKHRTPHLAFICVFTCVCTQEPEVGFSCHFSGPPCLWRQGLSLARNLLSKLDWLVGEPHGSPGNPFVFISLCRISKYMPLCLTFYMGSEEQLNPTAMCSK